MSRRVVLLLVATGLLQCAGCSGLASSDAVGESRSAVVYGNDDRTELYEVEDGDLRDFAARRSVAIVPATALLSTGMDVAVIGPPLAAAAQLCDGERFADEPAAVACTGVLMDDRTVLTAAHCLDSEFTCGELRFVFGHYYEASGQLHRIEASDVYGCAAVIATEHSPAGSAERVDYAWVRLDRVVPDVGDEVAIRDPSDELSAGERMTVVGFSSGLPLKLDENGRIVDARPGVLDYFVFEADVFEGSSGAPILDEAHRLVGIDARGRADYEQTEHGCAVPIRVGDDLAAGEEQATYAQRALGGLCANEPGHVLCRNLASWGRGNGSAGCHVPPAHGSGNRSSGIVLSCAIAVLACFRRRFARPHR